MNGKDAHGIAANIASLKSKGRLACDFLVSFIIDLNRNFFGTVCDFRGAVRIVAGFGRGTLHKWLSVATPNDILRRPVREFSEAANRPRRLLGKHDCPCHFGIGQLIDPKYSREFQSIFGKRRIVFLFAECDWNLRK